MTTDQLRALLAAATPGPWEWVEPHSVLHRIDTSVTDEALVPVAAVEGLFSRRHHNGALIVAAVNALPALLEVVEAAQAMKDDAPAYENNNDQACCAFCDAWLPAHDDDCRWVRLRAALARLDAA